MSPGVKDLQNTKIAFAIMDVLESTESPPDILLQSSRVAALTALRRIDSNILLYDWEAD